MSKENLCQCKKCYGWKDYKCLKCGKLVYNHKTLKYLKGIGIEDKKIKVLIEMPINWIDFESPLGMTTYYVHQEFERQLRRVIQEEVIKHIKLPKVEEIRPEEVRARMIDLLAREALEKRSDNAN